MTKNHKHQKRRDGSLFHRQAVDLPKSDMIVDSDWMPCRYIHMIDLINIKGS